MHTYTVREVGEMLKIKEGTVRALIRRGKLKSFKVGRMVRIDRDDLCAYVREQKEAQSRAPKETV